MAIIKLQAPYLTWYRASTPAPERCGAGNHQIITNNQIPIPKLCLPDFISLVSGEPKGKSIAVLWILVIPACRQAGDLVIGIYWAKNIGPELDFNDFPFDLFTNM
jgi:hypothetical protein